MERTNQIDFTGSRVKLQDLITNKLNENSYEDKTFLKIMDDQTLKVRIHQETESTRVGSQVRALRVSDFYVGCEGYMGQHFTWVIIFTWVAWVKIFFAWVNFFMWFKILCVSRNFLRGLSFGLIIFWRVDLKKSRLTLSLQYFAYFFHLHYVRVEKLEVKVN